jgi:hypothetical protein
MCTVDGEVIVLSPVGDPEEIPLGVGAGVRLAGSLRGKRVAVIDNQYPGMADIAAALDKILMKEYGANEVRHWGVKHSAPWDASVVNDIRQHADLAIVGLGNCGACTTWNCRFTAELLVAMPSLNVITRPFVAVARATLRNQGSPEAPLFILPNDPTFDSAVDFAEVARAMAGACQLELTGAAT